MPLDGRSSFNNTNISWPKDLDPKTKKRFSGFQGMLSRSIILRFPLAIDISLKFVKACDVPSAKIETPTKCAVT
jgi:hypothetical protein